MTQQEILNSTRTKTWKIQQLIGLGLSRTQVASLMGIGYGFVQNVYARMSQTSQTQPTEATNFILTGFEFNHTFGVEIEATGITTRELETELTNAGIQVSSEFYNHATREHWKITTDSSVRGENCFELVSPKLKGDLGLRELKTVLLIVRGLEAKVNRTCGLHIHFDATYFNLQTWKNILWNYASLENEIDKFMPISRRANNNTYCASIKRNCYESFLRNFTDTQNLESGLQELRSFYRNDRYFKVNLQSFLRHRSIEFRQHAGTVNYKKVENWIIFLARLIEFSKEATLPNQSEFATMGRFLDTTTLNYFNQRQNELQQAS